LKIHVVTPAPRGSRRGNRVSAVRWARLLRQLGHDVRVREEDDDEAAADLLIALHARHGARAIGRFRTRFPTRPAILALTGTDIYRDVERSKAAQRSLRLAHRLIVLQPLAIERLPPSLRGKARVVLQSVEPPRRVPPLKRSFEICVVGHLRAVKDPLRAALAARRLPRDSHIRIVQAGEALTPALRRRASRENRSNPRYRWIGPCPRHAARRLIGRSRLLVISSRLEGGANVVSEAIVARTPVLASAIPGNEGLLGGSYPGYFKPGDSRGLAALMRRAEIDRGFRAELSRHCSRLAPRFAPARERDALRDLLRELA
jgi:putative glycosyltransferase (TIGR04348 family)